MTDRPDAAPPKEKDNLLGVSRPNYCPDGATHSWDSYGDEWRCSFCPAVFRASPPSDAAIPKASLHEAAKDVVAELDKVNKANVTEADLDRWYERLQNALDRAAPPPDAALPEEGDVEITEDICGNRWATGVVGKQPPPSDAAPVAWRYRHNLSELKEGWLYTDIKPIYVDGKGGWTVHSLYARPEDAPEESNYQRGVRDGITMYAWWKDGEQYVGTCGTKLRDVLNRLKINDQT